MLDVPHVYLWTAHAAVTPYSTKHCITHAAIRHYNINSHNQYKKSLSVARVLCLFDAQPSGQCVYFSGFIFLPRFFLFLYIIFLAMWRSIYIYISNVSAFYYHLVQGTSHMDPHIALYIHCPVQRHGISSSGCHDIVCVVRTEKDNIPTPQCLCSACRGCSY